MKTKLLLVITSVFCLFAVGASAQVTTATINGTVVDDSGETLIGATVVATHMPSGVTYGTTTRTDGRYTLPNMKIGGPYEVQVSYIGFKDLKEEVNNLSIGQKLKLNFTMKSGM